MRKKILYVEDEPFLARIVSDGLRSSGYEVEWLADGNLVIDACNRSKPDICILDIMLPLRDGYSLAKELRTIDPGLPIIFLSAKVQTAEIVEGFRSGGNDYLRKPFSMDELLVRIEGLLQRFGNPNQQSMADDTGIPVFANCRFDLVRQRLTISNEEHVLSFKECALLQLLLDKKNDVLERQEALLKIWGDDSYYNTRSMDVYITRLRKMLKDVKGVEIINLRGVGFKLIC